jgi:HK97 gp10 family phage protein
MTNKPFRIFLDRMASKKAFDFMQKFPEKMQQANSIALFRIGTQVRSDAGKKAPFKTGTLRRSLTMPNDRNAIFKERKNEVEVGTNLVYARAQEFGYKNIRARRFLSKAIQIQKDGRGEQIFNQEINAIIE